MNLFEGKSPAERNKIIAASVLGVMALLALTYTFGGSLFGGRKVSVAANFDPGLCPDPAEAIRNAARSMRDLGFGKPPF